MTTTDRHDAVSDTATKREERRAFLFMAVLLAPILSVVIVGGYGFMVWMLQLIYGPPAG